MRITTTHANLPLDQKTFDKTIAGGAINLTNRKTSKELYKNRLKRMQKWGISYKTIFIWVIMLSIILLLTITPKAQTNALEWATVEDKAFNVIKKFEWYSDKPYWDQNQWSCGYWMRCSETTTWITREKSKWYVIQKIKSIRERFDLYKYDDNIEVALISFSYNTWHIPDWTDRYIRNGYINALKNQMKMYIYAGGIKLRWLEKRRNYETSLF